MRRCHSLSVFVPARIGMFSGVLTARVLLRELVNPLVRQPEETGGVARAHL